MINIYLDSNQGEGGGSSIIVCEYDDVSISVGQRGNSYAPLAIVDVQFGRLRLMIRVDRSVLAPEHVKTLLLQLDRRPMDRQTAEVANAAIAAHEAARKVAFDAITEQVLQVCTTKMSVDILRQLLRATENAWQDGHQEGHKNARAELRNWLFNGVPSLIRNHQ